MPAACRANKDVHSCGSMDTEGSGSVRINIFPAHRLDDGDSHGGTQNQGSGSVRVNGKPLARVGDNNVGEPVPPFHPPNPEATGSSSVNANG